MASCHGSLFDYEAVCWGYLPLAEIMNTEFPPWDELLIITGKNGGLGFMYTSYLGKEA